MKRILTAILAMLMLFACTVGNAEADWRTPYEEPVDVHIAVEENANCKFPEGQDYTNNIWWDLFRERYNINVIVDWSALQEYSTKANLAIASGEIPEMFRCNITQLNQLIDAGLLQDLSEVYETYASDSIKAMMENNWDIVETGARDGKIYAMPVLNYGNECETGLFWVRTDWAEKVGFEGAETIEDIEELMDSFMQECGAKYGIILEKGLDCFYRSSILFNAQPHIWIPDENGKLVYGTVQPEMKDALAKWAEWYQKGYIRPDFGTLTQDAANEDAFNGKVGMYFFAQWASWQMGQDMIKNQGDGSYFTAFDMPKTVDGELPKFPVAFNNSGYNVCSVNCEHPEVLIKLINAYCDVLNDSVPQGTMTPEEVIPFNTNDIHHVTGPFKVEFPSYQDAKDVKYAFETGKEDEFHSGYARIFYNEAKQWTDNGDPSGLGRYLQMGAPRSSLGFACLHVDRNQINKCAVWGEKPQEMLDYGSTLNDILLEGFTRIIMGEESVDYFDVLVENWRTAGGDILEAAVNEMYGAK